MKLICLVSMTFRNKSFRFIVLLNTSIHSKLVSAESLSLDGGFLQIEETTSSSLTQCWIILSVFCSFSGPSWHYEYHSLIDISVMLLLTGSGLTLVWLNVCGSGASCRPSYMHVFFFFLLKLFPHFRATALKKGKKASGFLPVRFWRPKSPANMVLTLRWQKSFSFSKHTLNICPQL